MPYRSYRTYGSYTPYRFYSIALQKIKKRKIKTKEVT